MTALIVPATLAVVVAFVTVIILAGIITWAGWLEAQSHHDTREDPPGDDEEGTWQDHSSPPA